MTNADTSCAREYQEASSLLPEDMSPRPVPRELAPRPYKLYRDLAPLPLPPPEELAAGRRPVQDEATLAWLLHFSAGVLRRRESGRRQLDFRAASSTGAQYHVEVYAVCGDAVRLQAGVYHFGPQDAALRRLRDGDYRDALRQALALDAGAEAYLVLSSEFWRNAWRYEARAYRHAFWDSGTMLANLLSLATDAGLAATVHTGFNDDLVNRLVCIDGHNEAALCIVALGRAQELPGSPPLETIEPAVVPASRVQIEYPAIQRLHRASVLSSADDVRRWRRGPPVGAAVRLPGGARPQRAIERRRSARTFAAEPLALDRLLAVLACAMQPLPLDSESAIGCGVIVNRVPGLAAGIYEYDAATNRLAACNGSVDRPRAAYLALGQAAAGEAAVNLYFHADLETVLARMGNRGYRAAQLEGGIRGGLVYLAASALGLRATALTFLDAEVAATFGWQAGRQAVFLAVIGR